MDNIEVAVRIRKLRKHEVKNTDSNQLVDVHSNWKAIPDKNIVVQTNFEGVPLPSKNGKTRFQYAHTYDGDATNQEIYHNVCQSTVQSFLHGINGTIITYGQTGSGKTFTMNGGDKTEIIVQQGIIQMAASDVFNHVQSFPPNHLKIYVSVFELYKLDINDLLTNETVSSRQNPDTKLLIDISKHHVHDFSIFTELVKLGNERRKVRSTQMNESSSRSHVVTGLTLVYLGPDNKKKNSSTLYFVDLAGSDISQRKNSRVDRMQLNETNHINKSLSSLSNVMMGLSRKTFVSFRSSILTRILQPFLEGEARVSFICCASPSGTLAECTRKTLELALCAKQIKYKTDLNRSLRNHPGLLKTFSNDEAVLNHGKDKNKIVNQRRPQSSPDSPSLIRTFNKDESVLNHGSDKSKIFNQKKRVTFDLDKNTDESMIGQAKKDTISSPPRSILKSNSDSILTTRIKTQSSGTLRSPENDEGSAAYDKSQPTSNQDASNEFPQTIDNNHEVNKGSNIIYYNLAIDKAVGSKNGEVDESTDMPLEQRSTIRNEASDEQSFNSVGLNSESESVAERDGKEIDSDEADARIKDFDDDPINFGSVDADVDINVTTDDDIQQRWQVMKEKLKYQKSDILQAYSAATADESQSTNKFGESNDSSSFDVPRETNGSSTLVNYAHAEMADEDSSDSMTTKDDNARQNHGVTESESIFDEKNGEDINSTDIFLELTSSATVDEDLDEQSHSSSLVDSLSSFGSESESESESVFGSESADVECSNEAYGGQTIEFIDAERHEKLSSENESDRGTEHVYGDSDDYEDEKVYVEDTENADDVNSEYSQEKQAADNKKYENEGDSLKDYQGKCEASDGDGECESDGTEDSNNNINNQEVSEENDQFNRQEVEDRESLDDDDDEIEMDDEDEDPKDSHHEENEEDGLVEDGEDDENNEDEVDEDEEDLKVLHQEENEEDEIDDDKDNADGGDIDTQINKDSCNPSDDQFVNDSYTKNHMEYEIRKLRDENKFLMRMIKLVRERRNDDIPNHNDNRVDEKGSAKVDTSSYRIGLQQQLQTISSMSEKKDIILLNGQNAIESVLNSLIVEETEIREFEVESESSNQLQQMREVFEDYQKVSVDEEDNEKSITTHEVKNQEQCNLQKERRKFGDTQEHTLKKKQLMLQRWEDISQDFESYRKRWGQTLYNKHL